ncbi:MAG TPA: hypothetical protein VIT18_06595 [Terrimicrobiaceae bacterium]
MSADYLIPFFFLFAGFGLFLSLLGAAASGKPAGTELVFRAPWVGYALLVGLLQLVHLFWPISRAVSTIVVAGLALGAAALLLTRASRGRWTWRAAGAGLGVAAVLGAISFVAFQPVFNSCTKEMCHYDLGLYYLKTLRWNEEFPIVPGLVNVQEHLALNQSVFLVIALVDSLVPNRLGIFLVGGFLPWLGLSLSLFAATRLILLAFRKEKAVAPIEVAYAVSLPAWLFTLGNAHISSASPDGIISCLSIHFFLIFAAFVVSGDQPARATNLSELILLGAACIVVKSICIGLVLAVWGVCLVTLCLKRDEFAGMLTRKGVLAMAAVSAIILTTWMGRGIILSGYPLFPSSALAMPVAWRIPVKYVTEFRGEIVRYAREADPSVKVKTTLRTWRWLPGWFERLLAMPNQFVWPAQVGVAGSAALVAFGVFFGPVRRNARHLLALTIPLLAYVLFWFFTVPGVRYFGPAMWIFAISPALAFAAGGPRVGLTALTATLVAAAIPLSFLAGEFHWSWSRPEPRLPKLRTMEIRAVTNEHGVELWVNPDGFQTYDAPLPSSWMTRPFLALLNPEKGLAGGFKFAKPATTSSDQVSSAR